MKLIKIIFLVFILVCSIDTLNAQNYKIDYNLKIGDLEWSVKGAQKKNNTSAFLISVKNVGTTLDEINLKGAKVFTSNMVFISKHEILDNNDLNDDNLILNPGEQATFRLDIPHSIFNEPEISILIDQKHPLNGIDLKNLQKDPSLVFEKVQNQQIDTNQEIASNNIPKPTTSEPVLVSNSWDDYIAKMRNQGQDVSNTEDPHQSFNLSSWEEFYKKNKRVSLTYKDMNEIYEATEIELANWEKKGEFETTDAWEKRVNQSSKKKYKEALMLKLINQHEKELDAQRDEQRELRHRFDQMQSENKKSPTRQPLSDSNQFTLLPYDADNELFLIRTNKYGDIQLSVPLKEAESFKNNWDKIKEDVKLEFTPIGDELRLTQIKFINGAKSYTYKAR